jgi:hypothetical protein
MVAGRGSADSVLLDGDVKSIIEEGVERPHVNVVLATSIPREICHQIDLGYMEPHSIQISDYMHKEDRGILFVDHAGEILYRLDQAYAKE